MLLSPSLQSLTRLALPAVLVLGLSACATPFKADVSRFAAPLPVPQGQTFSVVPEDPKLAGGIEFLTYANAVVAEMQKLGYLPASSPQSADLLVRFDYRVDGGRERIRTDFGGAGFGPGFGGWAGGAWGFGFNDPFFGGPDVRSHTVYTSAIELKIDRRADNQRLFEGKAEAISRSNRLPRLVPNLVDAMFTGFPGNSGETLRITIRDEENTVRSLD